MGVAKSWRFSLTPAAAKLALLQHQNGYNGGGGAQHAQPLRSTAKTTPLSPLSPLPPQKLQQRKPPPPARRWSLVCGLMLFGLGLVSLFTGHVASDLEWWYTQRVVNHGFYFKLVHLFLYVSIF